MTQEQSKPQVIEQDSQSQVSVCLSYDMAFLDVRTVEATQVLCHEQVQLAVDQTGKRVPLLTSSTESFKVGLKSYAELQIPKHTVSGGYAYICCVLHRLTL